MLRDLSCSAPRGCMHSFGIVPHVPVQYRLDLMSTTCGLVDEEEQRVLVESIIQAKNKILVLLGS